MLELEFIEVTDCGRVRDHNEDFLGHVIPETPGRTSHHAWLFALADGVGGHDGGEVASRAAIESVLDGFRAADGKEAPAALLPRLIQEANACIYGAGAGRPGGTQMATTMVACALQYDRAVVAHVGDSRCYLIHRGAAKPLTRDHTVANEHLRMGLISPKEALNSPHRHVLSRSVGNDLFVNVDVTEHLVQPGDALLLCSDGLHGPVTESEMAGVVTHAPDLAVAAKKLVAVANDRDGSDNVSIQIVRIRSVERVGMYRGRPYRLR